MMDSTVNQYCLNNGNKVYIYIFDISWDNDHLVGFNNLLIFTKTKKVIPLFFLFRFISAIDLEK
jgi:hypothetical protein